MTFRLIIILFFSSIFFSCHKDSDILNEEITSTFSPEVVEEIQGDILGYVYDENNLPVKDATVQIYSGTTKTNDFGVFSFKNARMDKNGTFIRVFKPGFIFGSDMVYPDKAKVYSYIKLLRLENNKSFESDKGGVIEITGGGKVTFPADGIAKSDGTSYSGKVNVTAKLLSPNAEDLAEIMPGALVGTASNGNTVVLGTAGMIAVELRDEIGGKLNLKKNSKAKIEIPALSDAKPLTIPLWYFDESIGLWIEEGVATLMNGNYTGEVSHFSFWNCDVPFPLINVCGKVLFADGSPAKQVKVAVSADGLNTSFGFTDENGVFCGKMPKNKILTFKILNVYCEGVFLEKVLGPFGSNTQLDPFSINVNKTVIFGTVKCNGVNNSNTTLILSINDKKLIFEPKENGIFEYNITSLICSNVSNISIFAYDNASGQASQPINITASNTQELIIETCANPCDFEGSLTYDCELSKLSAMVSGGSGNYSFLWNTGSNASSIQLENDSLGGVYCVTITEIVNGCSKNYCQQVNSKLQVNIGSNCQNSGKVNSIVRGGVMPYTYLWSNGSTNNFIEINTSNDYCLTVTDALGCTSTTCAYIAIEGLFIAETSSQCDKDQFTIESSEFNSGRIFGNNVPGSTIGALPITYPINLSVFSTGFVFNVVIFTEFCEKGRQIQLPQFKGLLDPVIKNSSCDSCNDGRITINTNPGADCLKCTVGGTKVFNILDLNTDLSVQNDAQMLGKGEYYIVVTDSNTGCYIAFKKVKIL